MPGLFQVPPRAAAAEDLDARRRQPAGELDQARLVADAENRSFNLGRRHVCRWTLQDFSGRRTNREHACVTGNRRNRWRCRQKLPLPAEPARHDSTSRRPFQRATPGHRPPLRPRSPAQKGRRSFFPSGERASARGDFRARLSRLAQNPAPRPCVSNSARRTRHATREPQPPRRLLYSQRSAKRIFIVRRRQELPAS